MIYKETNMINGKVYIGRTLQTLEKRKYKHEIAKDNLYFHQALRKYGKENFKWEIINEQDYDNEEFYIQKYNSRDRNIGYNVAKGGSGGDTYSNHPNKEEILKKRSNSMKEKWKDEEYSNKLLKIRKEFGQTAKFKKKVSQNSKKMWTEEKKKKHSEFMKEKWKNDTEFRKSQSKIRSEGRKGKNNPMAKKYLIIKKDGTKIECHGNLKQFCIEEDVSYSILLKFCNKGKIPKALKRNLAREKIEGWEVRKVKND